MSNPPAPRREQPHTLSDAAREMKDAAGKGIALMILAMLLFALMDTTAKHLTATYPIPQILWVRYLLFMGFALFVARRQGVGFTWRAQRGWLQIFLALLSVAEVGTFILAFHYLPLADAHAIGNMAPLIATALAGPLLHEKVGRHRWIAVAIGFAGVFMIIRPGAGMMGRAAYIPLLGAFLWATYQLLVRLVTRSDRPETTLIYTAVVGAVVLTFVAPWQWRPADTEGWILFFLVGLLGSCAHFVLIKALQITPASVLQPFNYTLTLWATVLGLIVFGDFPTPGTLVGAAVVVASGLYAIYRERAL